MIAIPPHPAPNLTHILRCPVSIHPLPPPSLPLPLNSWFLIPQRSSHQCPAGGDIQMSPYDFSLQLPSLLLPTPCLTIVMELEFLECVSHDCRGPCNYKSTTKAFRNGSNIPESLSSRKQNISVCSSFIFTFLELRNVLVNGYKYAPSQRWRSTTASDPFPYCKLQHAQIDMIPSEWMIMGTRKQS